MLSGFLRSERILNDATLAVSILMLAISVSLGFYQVLTRFLFNAPSTWTEAISRTTMIWCVFMAMPETFRHGFMMAVEVIYKLVPQRRLIFIESVIAACCLLVLGVLVYHGALMTQRVSGQLLSGVEISMAWAYAAIPIGAVEPVRNFV